MKSKLTLLFSLLAPVLFGAVSETPTELHTNGDFNGDGRRDLVIVDRATGVYRIGYGQADGSQLWADPRPSGIERVSGVTVGRLLTASRDALAFTAPDANRVNVFDASSATTAGQPTNVFLSSIGPNAIAALDIGGAGNTGHDDLFVPSLANVTNAPYRATLVRATGTNFSQSFDTNLPARVIHTEAVRLKTITPFMVGSLLRTTPETSFVVHNLASGAPAQFANALNLPDVDAFVYANFNSSAFHQFLFYKGGGSNLTLRPVIEPVPGQVKFDVGTTFAFPDPLREVITVPDSGETRLLIVIGQGDIAGVYSFDGTNAPVLVESFNAEPGETFTGAAALGNGHFSLYSGNDGISARFQNWNRTGNTYTKGATGDLPKVNPLATSANVFLFVNQPFVHPTPRLVGSLNAADWSSQPTVPPPPGQVTVQAEQFKNSAEGLGDATSRSLGSAPAGAAFALANQIAGSYSLLSFSPAIGQEVAEVNVSPKPGRYPVGVSLTFITPTPVPVFYRFGETENWRVYNGVPVPLFKNTTVSYYAQSGSRKSTIRHAAYSFDTEPSALDTDGDGVPDFVELGLGGSDAAVHNKDSDGDGYSDLAEILAGTNGAPFNPNIAPANQPRSDELAAFDWAVSPRAYVEVIPAMVGCETNTVISTFDLHGSLQRTAPSVSFFGLSLSYFQNLFADVDQRLYVAATEPHFAVRTNDLAGFPAGGDTRIGRELLSMLPVPNLSSELQVNYTYGGGTLSQEASNWVAAAQAAQAAIVHPQFWQPVTFETTLASLLVERKIGELLVARGLLDATNHITLFPHRPQDAGRHNPPHTNLLALETNALRADGLPDPAKPGFKLVELHNAFSLAITSPPTAQVEKLRDIAFDIYRISAASNNAAPGQYPSPVDTLRGFIESGVLHSNYAAATSLASSDLAAAASGVAQVLNGVSARSTTHLTLRVATDSFATPGCTVLETLTGSRRALVLPDGTAYKFPEAFQLVPGSEVIVDAYTDLPPSCGAATLEIITLALTTIPAVSATDVDGDLLSDAWEALFLISDANSDNDGDGANNLKEFLDGTDPLNALSKLAGSNPQPPQIQVTASLQGGLQLRWFYPEQYAGKVKFDLLSADALGGGFIPVAGAAQHLGEGQFEVSLPDRSAPARFYQLQMSLK